MSADWTPSGAWRSCARPRASPRSSSRPDDRSIGRPDGSAASGSPRGRSRRLHRASAPARGAGMGEGRGTGPSRPRADPGMGQRRRPGLVAVGRRDLVHGHAKRRPQVAPGGEPRGAAPPHRADGGDPHPARRRPRRPHPCLARDAAPRDGGRRRGREGTPESLVARLVPCRRRLGGRTMRPVRRGTCRRRRGIPRVLVSL